MGVSPKQLSFDIGATTIVCFKKNEDDTDLNNIDLKNKNSTFTTLFFISYDKNKKRNLILDLNVSNINSNDSNPKNIIKGLKNNLGFGLKDLKENPIEKLKLPFTFSTSTSKSTVEIVDKNGKDLELDSFILYEEFLSTFFESTKEKILDFDESNILCSFPNVYTTYQQSEYKKMIQRSSKSSNVSIYSESMACLLNFLFGNSNQISLSKGQKIDLSTLRNVLILDQGDSSTNITSCKIENGKFSFFHSGSCQLGGQTYTSIIYDFVNNQLKNIGILKRKSMFIDIEVNKKKEFGFKTLNIEGIEITPEVARKLTSKVHVAINRLVEDHKKDFNVKEIDLVIYNGGGMGNSFLTEYLESNSLKGYPIYSQSTGLSVSRGLHYCHALMKIPKEISILNYPTHSIYIFYQEISKSLPITNVPNSILICKLSGKIMDHNNEPMILPNGNCYSKNALLEMSSKTNGIIIDPKTGEKFEYSKLRKAYIM